MALDVAHYWPLEVSQIFEVWFYAPLVLLFPATLLAGQRRAIGALGIPLFVFLVGYGHLWMPKPTQVVAASESSVLRVMSWNTWQTDDKARAFAEAVREEQPDVVALQEVDGALIENLRELTDVYPYQVYALVGGRGHAMILSRWPILDQTTDVDWMGCWCLRVTIDWQGQPVHVANVHVWSPVYDFAGGGNIPWVRSFQSGHQARVVDVLLADISEVDLPLVVLGDFNTVDRQPNYARLIDSGLIDAQRAIGHGLRLTYPVPYSSISWLPVPLIRIDYVFTDSAFSPVDFSRLEIAGSDHFGVLADLVLR